ncbi:MAG TPA: zinc-ribbon domain-containing protein [Pyrinomonadaceae bacterium]
MFLIIGLGRSKKRDYGDVAQVRCPRCSNTVSYRHTHTRTWLTLYFIPVLPYRSERRLECPICSHGVRVLRDDVEEIRLGKVDLLARLEEALGASTRMIS